jgi:hypothetical protein
MLLNAPSKSRTRQQLELTVLGFLVGLIIKTVLDSVFKDSFDNPIGICAIGAAIWKCNVLAFAVFFFALLRFLFGAWRFHEVSKDDHPSKVKLWSLVMMLAVFLVFYAAGLTIKAPVLLAFYELFALAHVVDLFWFAPIILPAAFKRLIKTIKNRSLNDIFRYPADLAKRAAYKFVVLDLLTLLLLFICLPWFGCWVGVPKIAGSGLIIIGIVDIYWNSDFYFDELHSDVKMAPPPVPPA